MKPSAPEQNVEISAQPCFMPGAKVRAVKLIKNDGTYPHRDIGDILVRKGDVGYVRDIGTFLQRFYVYAVEFVDRGVVVGMRGRELVAADRAEAAVAPERDASVQEPAA
jgi:nitrogen fixation protein NifZ